MTKNELSRVAAILGLALFSIAGYAMFGEGGGMIGLVLGFIWAAYIYHEK